jgi:hypothetical protein
MSDERDAKGESRVLGFRRVVGTPSILTILTHALSKEARCDEVLLPLLFSLRILHES